ncbi:EscG/YscG/SsaH family type III secretion system needle protein co-chaperone [Burkholderia sp. Bp9126]|nr:EscG/YscG/SsaH family type III secretion system needle protein co-chaperone [Burkholderia sp. Bp9126]
MTTLEQAVHRLIVECGLAATNHGLTGHAWAIYDMLPVLVSDPADRRLIEATMLIGFGHDGAAERLLEQAVGPQAAVLRQLLAPRSLADNAPPSHSSDFSRIIDGYRYNATRATCPERKSTDHDGAGEAGTD